MTRTKPIIKLIVLLGLAAPKLGLIAQTVNQTAKRSSCANIVALSGAKVDRSNLTPAQRKAIENIPSILKMTLENQGYLDEIMKKLEEIPEGAMVQKGNSGSISIQQGTAGENSPIINSPITVGSVPKAISPSDRATLKQYFLSAKNKAKVKITTDQFSGTAPFPDDFYDVLKVGGWEMVDAGVTHAEALYAPGRVFQGAIVTVYGDPVPEGQAIQFSESDPLIYIGNALQAFKIPHVLNRNKSQPEGVIDISFQGGFPQ